MNRTTIAEQLTAQILTVKPLIHKLFVLINFVSISIVSSYQWYCISTTTTTTLTMTRRYGKILKHHHQTQEYYRLCSFKMMMIQIILLILICLLSIVLVSSFHPGLLLPSSSSSSLSLPSKITHRRKILQQQETSYSRRRRFDTRAIQKSYTNDANWYPTIALYLARDRNGTNRYNNKDKSTTTISSSTTTGIESKKENKNQNNYNQRTENKNIIQWYVLGVMNSSAMIGVLDNNNNTEFNDSTYCSNDNEYDDDYYEKLCTKIEQFSIIVVSNLIRQRLQCIQQQQSQQIDDVTVNETMTQTNETKEFDDKNTTIIDSIDIHYIVYDRFMDLTCTEEGEDVLDDLFIEQYDYIVTMINDIIQQQEDDDEPMTNEKKIFIIEHTIRASIMVLQSLCVMGTQVGVKGPPEQLRRMVEHLSDRPSISSTSTSSRTGTRTKQLVSYNDQQEQQQIHDLYYWNKDSVRRLKYRINRTPAIQLLSSLKWKQTPQGAFDLLVALKVWTIHEDLALLRSGFPIRFTYQEERITDKYVMKHRKDTIATQQEQHIEDVDTILGIRQDLRHLKVYTIDGADAGEIDDGISIERVHDDRYRIWVHIADAESWAPPGSDLFEMARRRITSLYLPNESIPMFPSKIGTDLMSLKVNENVRALSLGVVVNDDGSLNESTIIVTPSIIRVSYRLTYDEVDEMLEEGIGFNEEWEIGTLLTHATKRRQFRIRNGSSEGMIPNPIPSSSVSIYTDNNSVDSIGISISIGVSHNAALNKTVSVECSNVVNTPIREDPVSSAYLLVTEAMILAGEAIGVWKSTQDGIDNKKKYPNSLRLPFRAQTPPDFKGRSRERNVMMNLLESNAGMGYCYAWYSRRFLESVSVTEIPTPHSGLGLNCYVQWSSPIRRFSDLQVHASVKRYLRRRKAYELINNGETIPDGVRAVDLGIPANLLQKGHITPHSVTLSDLDKDIDYMDGIGLVAAGKKLQRLSQQYWLFEYIRRMKETNAETTFTVIVLGCVDPERYQFAIYVKELGLEHRYTSPAGRLEPGAEFRVKVDTVNPRSGLLSFVRVI